MNEMDDKQLQSVTGGLKREKTIRVEIKVGGYFNENITIKPYLDGELQSALIKTVDYSTEIVYMNFTAMSGYKSLKIKLNDTVELLYELNFDTGTYTQIQI